MVGEKVMSSARTVKGEARKTPLIYINKCLRILFFNFNYFTARFARVAKGAERIFLLISAERAEIKKLLASKICYYNFKLVPGNYCDTRLYQ